MASTHLEIERKFDVDPSFVVPDLTAVDGVTAVDEPVEHELSAVYHDTADLRLLRARVTLRRRSGGTDAGWHLKLPAAGARRELHAPLGRGRRTPPRALLEPVTGIVRGAPVGPVATLTTRRVVRLLRGADAKVLVEVADDTVTASVPAVAPDQPAELSTWREVEAELVDGDEALLAAVGDRLMSAGARPADVASKAQRVLAGRLAAVAGPVPAPASTGGAGKNVQDLSLTAIRGQVEALQQADLMVRTEAPDAVHDVRVAARRLRSILAAFRPVLAREVTDPIRDELAWLGRELTGVRDGEVALTHLRQVVAAQPEELVLGPVAARLQQAALAQAQQGGTLARRVLSDHRYLRLLDALFELLADPPVTALASSRPRPVLRDAVRRAGRRLRRQIKAAQQAPDASRDAGLHEVRKAAKRTRYVAEVAAPVLGRRTAELAACMERIQDVLGERQDTVLTREQCRRLGLAAFAAGENAWTYGRLHGLEEARAERAEAAFRDLQPAIRRLLKAVK